MRRRSVPASSPSLAAGAPLEEALRLGTRMGARNVTHRAPTGLRDHLLAGSRRCDTARRSPRPVRRSLGSTKFRQRVSPRRRRTASGSCSTPTRPNGRHRTDWVGLLSAGQAVRGAGGGSAGARKRPLLTRTDACRGPDLLDAGRILPRSSRAVRDPREGAARESGDESDVLLPVTPVRRRRNVQRRSLETSSSRGVGHPGVRAGARPEGDDGLRYGAFRGVSEYCRTRGHGRWVAVAGVPLASQAGEARGLDRGGGRGIGFRHSSTDARASVWDALGGAAALEAALIQGVSRFRDPGRGQGLARDPALPGPLEREDRDPQRDGPLRDPCPV